MKKIFFILLSSTVILSSCDKEDTVIKNKEFIWPEGTNEYAPYTIGSTFDYEMRYNNPTKVDSFKLIVTKDTVINNLIYYKLVSNKPEIQPSYFVNTNNGNLTEITYNLDYLNLGAIIVPKVLETTLKENLLINDTWNESMVVTYPTSPTTGINLNVTFDHTMTNKNYTKRVLDVDFPNCIAIKQVISTIIPPGFPWPPNVPITSQFDNYYAKGAGLIQRDVSNGTIQRLMKVNIIK